MDTNGFAGTGDEARSQVSGNADGPDRLAGNVNRSFQLFFQRLDQGLDEF
jgi:hypothetical protein